MYRYLQYIGNIASQQEATFQTLGVEACEVWGVTKISSCRPLSRNRHELDLVSRRL
jgi:hypothetical protein